MEFIQWYTSVPTHPGHTLKEPYTRHAIFRLDSLDKDILNPDVIKWAINEEAKDAAENGRRPGNTHLSLRVSEDDQETYNKECVKMFSILMNVPVV